MKLLVLGGLFLVKAFREQGHTVISAGPLQQADIPVFHPLSLPCLLKQLREQGFVPDALLYTDNGNLPQFPDVEYADCPSLFYSVDTFCNPWHLPFAYAFDGVYAAQKGHADLFAAEGHPTLHLPLFCPQPIPDVDDPAVPRDIPVSFVGTLRPRNIPSRLPFLERFRTLHPLFFTQGAYQPVFVRSRIVLNQTAASELNFRCFEAPACGAALLMEQCADLEDVFTPGENILPPYPRGNAAAAAATAREWLARPDDLARVARAGKALVERRHTAAHRARTVARRLETLLRDGAGQRRQAELPLRRRRLSTAYAILAAELNNPELSAHRRLFFRLYERCLDGERNPDAEKLSP